MTALWKTLAAVIPIAALTLSMGAGAVFCSATLSVPRRSVPVSGALPGKIQDVSLQARDGVRLEASYLSQNTDGAACVMVLHGVADSRSGALGFAPMFLESGYSVLVPDSRAHGRSGGDLVTYGLLERYDVLD